MTYNTLISAMDSWSLAFLILEEIDLALLRRDVITYNATRTHFIGLEARNATAEAC